MKEPFLVLKFQYHGMRSKPACSPAVCHCSKSRRTTGLSIQGLCVL